MARKKSGLTSLIAQRQILLAESDLNRIHLFQEWNKLKAEIHRAANPAKKVVTIISVAAKAGMLFSFVKRFISVKKETDRQPAQSVFKHLFNGVKTGFSIWRLLRVARR